MVVVRFFAAARAAAGTVEVAVEAAGPLEGVCAAVAAALPGSPRLPEVLAVCTFLVDGHRAGAGTVVADGAVVEALPPFAGG